jgi:hypothetical protein
MSKILYKTPAESFIYTIGFEKSMEQTESISTISSLTISPPHSGTETITIDSSPLIVGKDIQFRISGGTDGQSYKVTAVITTSLGNTMEEDFILVVRNDI